jgi:hypothetical protein
MPSLSLAVSGSASSGQIARPAVLRSASDRPVVVVVSEVQIGRVGDRLTAPPAVDPLAGIDQPDQPVPLGDVRCSVASFVP